MSDNRNLAEILSDVQKDLRTAMSLALGLQKGSSYIYVLNQSLMFAESAATDLGDEVNE